MLKFFKKIKKRTWIISGVVAAVVLILATAGYFLWRSSADTVTGSASFAASNYEYQNAKAENNMLKLAGSSTSGQALTLNIADPLRANNGGAFGKWYVKQTFGKKYLKDFSDSEILTILNSDTGFKDDSTIRVDMANKEKIFFKVQNTLPANFSTAGKTITKVTLELKQQGVETYAFASTSWYETFGKLVEESSKCTGNPCTKDFIFSWEDITNGIIVGVTPNKLATGQTIYGLDKISLKVQYTDASISLLNGQVKLATPKDSGYNDTQWTKFSISGPVKVPAGTMAQIRWFASNSLTDLANATAIGSAPANVSSSPIITLQALSSVNLVNELQTNGVFPKGRYGKFIIGFTTNSASITPEVYSVIMVNYLANTGTTPPTGACPTITGFTPAAAVSNTNITVIGTNLSTSTRVSLVNTQSLQTHDLNVISGGGTMLLVQLVDKNTNQAIAAGTYKVQVAASGCGSLRSTATLTVSAATTPTTNCPTITSSPASIAYSLAGSYILVSGTNFGTSGGQLNLISNTTGTTYGLYDANDTDPNTFWGNTQIKAKLFGNVPAGTYSLYVKAGNCDQVQSGQVLTITGTGVTPPTAANCPALTNIDKNYFNKTASTGTLVTLTGTNLGTAGKVEMISANGDETLPVTISSANWTSNQIKFNVPQATKKDGLSADLPLGKLNFASEAEAFNDVLSKAGYIVKTVAANCDAATKRIIQDNKDYYFKVTPATVATNCPASVSTAKDKKYVFSSKSNSDIELKCTINKAIKIPFTNISLPLGASYTGGINYQIP